MKIYEFSFDTGKRGNNCQYQLVNRDRNYLNKFDEYLEKAERVKEYLSDLRIWVIDGRKECDCSILWNGSNLRLVNEKTKELLTPIVGEDVEFILMSNGLYLINALCVADALDLENIEAHNGYIDKFSFRSDKLPKSAIFRVMYEDDIYVGAWFVTERFKEVVEENHLTGFKFEEIGDF